MMSGKELPVTAQIEDCESWSIFCRWNCGSWYLWFSGACWLLLHLFGYRIEIPHGHVWLGELRYWGWILCSQWTTKTNRNGIMRTSHTNLPHELMCKLDLFQNCNNSVVSSLFGDVKGSTGTARHNVYWGSAPFARSSLINISWHLW